MRYLKIVGISFFLVLIFAGVCAAKPSENIYRKGDHLYDEWGVCRTNAVGENGFFQVREEGGFRPIIAFESLGKNKDIACSLAENLASKYQDRQTLAEQIFDKAKTLIDYTSDKNQYGYNEYAQNADELAGKLVEKGQALGDCEDYAILLSVMYEATGFRSAIVLAPGHAACLVYLPGYEKANVSWTFENEKGWVWAEATGQNNYLGWTPEEYIGEQLMAYEMRDRSLQPGNLPEGAEREAVESKGGGTSGGIPFFNVIFILWIIPIIARAL